MTGIGTLYVDGAFWFETGERSRKDRDTARDPRCALSLATDAFDLVVEGEAERVTDPATTDMAARWAAEGWPAACRRVRPGDHRRLRPRRVQGPRREASTGSHHAATALRTVRSGGATRWTFR